MPPSRPAARRAGGATGTPSRRTVLRLGVLTGLGLGTAACSAPQREALLDVDPREVRLDRDRPVPPRPVPSDRERRRLAVLGGALAAAAAYQGAAGTAPPLVGRYGGAAAVTDAVAVHQAHRQLLGAGPTAPSGLLGRVAVDEGGPVLDPSSRPAAVLGAGRTVALAAASAERSADDADADLALLHARVASARAAQAAALRGSGPVDLAWPTDLAGPADPDLADPDLVDPDPADPDLADPDLVDPDPADPDLADPDLVDPDPADPDLADPDLVDPDPADPDLADPDLVDPDPADPDLADPDLVDPDPADPDLADPDLVDPDPADPDLADPDLVDALQRLLAQEHRARWSYGVVLAWSTDRTDDAGGARLDHARRVEALTSLLAQLGAAEVGALATYPTDDAGQPVDGPQTAAALAMRLEDAVTTATAVVLRAALALDPAAAGQEAWVAAAVTALAEAERSRWSWGGAPLPLPGG
ncbi:hypothetical protein [Aquipuribacter sp. MA13-6]|uniref:hypothetical protein n=1 Tax=Aquipuribacter sp. MA13-6 TaxID=3440839 RepID=UPI003EE8F6FC